jgi:hypothetical protein
MPWFSLFIYFHPDLDPWKRVLRFYYCCSHGGYRGYIIDASCRSSHLFFQLYKYRKATPWKTTDSLITKLIYHTIETSAITVVFALLDLGLFFPTAYYPGIP